MIQQLAGKRTTARNSATGPRKKAGTAVAARIRSLARKLDIRDVDIRELIGEGRRRTNR